MKTVALRFADNFAPDSGTIAEHKIILKEFGYVWYGKLGTPISKIIAQQILNNKEKRILLIHSGSVRRYWAYVDMIQRDIPDKNAIPKYYRNMAESFNTWFPITKIEDAPKDILSRCIVASSGSTLSQASKHSMSPYFIIETE